MSDLIIHGITKIGSLSNQAKLHISLYLTNCIELLYSGTKVYESGMEAYCEKPETK